MQTTRLDSFTQRDYSPEHTSGRRRLYGNNRPDSRCIPASELLHHLRRSTTTAPAVHRENRLSVLEPLPTAGLLDPLDYLLTSTHRAHAGSSDRPGSPSICFGSTDSGDMAKEEAEGPEMEEGEWLEDLDSYRSSAICSSPSIFHPSPRQSRLQVRPKSIPPTTPVKEQKHPVFPDMLNTPARREEKRNGEEREDEHLSSAKRRPQSYDRFYYRGMSVEGREDTATVHENTGSAAAGRTDRSEAMRVEVEKGYTQTEPVPSVTQPHLTANSDSEKGTLSPSSLPRSRTPLVFFILGFFLPLLWLVGGWLLPHSSTQTPETEIIPQTITHYLPRWLFHSNYTVLACRIASLASLSFFLIAGITLAIVLPITL